MTVDTASGALRGHDPAAGQPDDTSILETPKRADAARPTRLGVGTAVPAQPSRIRRGRCRPTVTAPRTRSRASTGVRRETATTTGGQVAVKAPVKVTRLNTFTATLTTEPLPTAAGLSSEGQRLTYGPRSRSPSPRSDMTELHQHELRRPRSYALPTEDGSDARLGEA